MRSDQRHVAVPRRRVIVEMQRPNARTYVSDDDLFADDDDQGEQGSAYNREWFYVTSLDEVAERLGISRTRVDQIQQLAIEKIKIAFELEARLGPARAVNVLTKLRGKPLAVFRGALAACATNSRRVVRGDTPMEGQEE